ncbi:MAG: M48 family metallopeptidase, partial [Candidatus Saccharicenans sp.]
QQALRPKNFIPGEKFLYLGKEYPLILSLGQTVALSFNGEAFFLSASGQIRARALFEKLYRKMARSYLSRRVEELATINGFEFQKFRLSSARSRWGSCSARKTISLTWRLIMAPPQIIDYVIIHELAHTREKNHSRAFWNLVAQYVPDYKSKRRWLKSNGFRFNL